MKTVFLRVLEADDKATALLQAVRDPRHSLGFQRFDVDVASFRAVPRSPFAYWVSDRLRRLFKELPSFESGERVAKQGLATADDFRFVRCWWATPPRQVRDRWFPFAKGGKFSPFYADVYLVVNWNRDGAEIRGNLNELGGIRSNVWMLRDTAANFFFRSGLTWTVRARRFAPQVLDAGCVFSHRGYSCFLPEDERLACLGLFNSSTFDYLFKITLGRFGFPEFLVGILPSIPMPLLSMAGETTLADLARRGWTVKRRLDSCVETSHAFTLPAILQVDGETPSARASAWADCVRTFELELEDIQSEIDQRCFDLYDIDRTDRRAISEGFRAGAAEAESSGGADEAGLDPDRGEDVDPDEDEPAAGVTMLAAELVSWAVGCAFGRFDVRLATGARALPSVPEPFDSLPACSAGMLTGDDDMPVSQAPSGYSLAIPTAGVLVDDSGQTRDLTSAVRTVVDVVFGVDADRWWNALAALLDPRSHDVRVWLGDRFFEHHLRRYSKSRRKAPIFWQLGTPSGRYSVWLYAHRLSRDSFFQLQHEVLGPKLSYEERQLTDSIQNAAGSTSASERKKIVAQEAVVDELRAMLDEVKRVAPLWNPNLDDGVVLTMAPLWRLLSQHRPWQKELRNKWNELTVGKYDWAHIAMHLWPERVVPKCATDLSLAFAHGLENVFWLQDADKSWKARATPAESVEELIRERSSPAVKAALKSLLEAPTALGSGRLRGRDRASSTTASEGDG